MKSGRSAFSSGGGGAPPHADNLYRCPPLGLSVFFPFLVVILVLLRLCLCPTLGSLLTFLLLVLPSWRGGGVILSHPPMYPLPPPTLIPPLLPLLPCPLTPRVGWVCLLRILGLGRYVGFAPAVACASFSGVPLLPNGGGAPYPHPIPCRRSLVAPSLPLCLVV